MTKGSSWILRLYFAVISAIMLVTLVFGTIDLLSIGLKTYVFKMADVPDYIENCSVSVSYMAPVPASDKTSAKVDEANRAQALKDCETRVADSLVSYKRQKATSAIHDIALILIALPLFALHFRFVYKDWLEERKQA